MDSTPSDVLAFQTRLPEMMSGRSLTTADVIVVGAGPAGSMTAHELAKAGARVLMLEEDRQVGAPCHCAGLVSPRTLELAGIDVEQGTLRAYRRARVWGPLGSTAYLESDRVQAVAIDRSAFDRHLARRAQEAGARLWLGVRASEFERLNGKVRITAVNSRGREHLEAPVLIGADGVRSQVSRWLDGQTRSRVLPAMKADVRFQDLRTEDIEIFVGSDIAPGWFGWIIPLEAGDARLGLGGFTTDLKVHFERFLELVAQRFGSFEVLGERGWMIPIEPLSRIAFDNGLLVGDAARQAKPSSGGGIYMGMRAGMLAAQAVLEGLNRDGPGYASLHSYEERWFEQEGDELRYNHWLRSIYNHLSDAEIDRLVSLCSRPWAKEVIRRLGDIDFASNLFRPIHMALGSVAPRLLQRLAVLVQRGSVESIEEDLEGLWLDPQALVNPPKA